MPAPHYLIIANQADGTHQRNPSWVVAFIRYNEPASMYSAAFGTTDQDEREKLAAMVLSDVKHSTLVVENDCVSIDTNNSKSSFAKMCNMRVKVGDIYYPNCVAPGDWAMGWIVNSQTDADAIATLLKNNSNGGGQLNNFMSGLKFIGRVIGVNDADDIQVNGVRSLTQMISCQAFLEMATSIYYTALSRSAPLGAKNVPANTGDPANQKATQQDDQTTASQMFQDLNIRNVLAKNLGDKFVDFYNQALSNGNIISPDSVIMFSFMLAMGVSKVDNVANMDGAIQGEISDAIEIPTSLSNYLNLKNANHLWQIYNLYLGLQKYGPTNPDSPWLSAFPTTPPSSIVSIPVGPSGSTDAFFVSPFRCKGAVPFAPPLWDNVSLWDFLNRFLHTVTNEMYTVLRVNENNSILPALVVREKPFGTNLFNILNLTPSSNITSKSDQASSQLDSTNNDPTYDDVTKKVKELNFTSTSAFLNPDQTNRTMFGNIFRWAVDDSMVQSVRVTNQESNRVNFVQVFGRSAGFEQLFPNFDQEIFKHQQFSIGNFVSDPFDIKRNGLRSIVLESQFDIPVKGSQAPFWAKMNADWLFNGHLKTSGVVTLYGVQEPICEGDNLQVRGVVYHIDTVNHSAQIGTDGKKTFMTAIGVSNGILATSLDTNDINTLPAYPVHTRQTLRSNLSIRAPGVTDMQLVDSTRRSDSGDTNGT